MKINWIGDYCIRTAVRPGGITITANRDGLLSLAEICRALADEPEGSHLHLDEYNSLEEGSAELIIERTDG